MAAVTNSAVSTIRPMRRLLLRAGAASLSTVSGMAETPCRCVSGGGRCAGVVRFADFIWLGSVAAAERLDQRNLCAESLCIQLCKIVLLSHQGQFGIDGVACVGQTLADSRGDIGLQRFVRTQRR